MLTLHAVLPETTTSLLCPKGGRKRHEAGETTQQLEVLFQRTQVLFPTHTLGSSQSPVTPAPGGQESSPRLCRHPSCTNTHISKNSYFNYLKEYNYYNKSVQTALRN